ncbi:antitoxin VbhA family protein [Janthinobacterium aquaticum]|uniref:antitoxin VbhA family protein n=1 Tax=Janthinobacterium sp. FT58W TaxID=2654254 RepID=UPI00126442D3|nr:antitoxin VbhA family protein [Janthinobacterium sp. FT58W]KAB8041270.1 hypothetical protein GCM43_19740 [Janthinobacterium sp. FT58W]
MTKIQDESSPLAAQLREDIGLAASTKADVFARLREQYDADMQAYDAAQKQKNIERQSMSAEQRERHEALDFARANVELSGGKISEEEWQHGLRWANGEIDMDAYIAGVAGKHGSTG